MTRYTYHISFLHFVPICSSSHKGQELGQMCRVVRLMVCGCEDEPGAVLEMLDMLKRNPLQLLEVVKWVWFFKKVKVFVLGIWCCGTQCMSDRNW